jgi:hypothetical protein
METATMPSAVKVQSEAVQDILQETKRTRDALPYTDEFEELYTKFLAETSKKLTRHEFWRKLSNAAKRGGWKGKNRGESAPDLTHQQTDILRTLAAGKLGSRDSLAYSNELEEIRNQFNRSTNCNLTQHQIWRLICNLGKRSRKPEVDALLKQSLESLILGIEHFNRPSECGRLTSILIMLDHAAEMFLKAALLDRGGDIRNPKNGYTHSVETCLNRATDDADIRFLTEDERRTLLVLNGLRDQAQHYIADVSEQILYTIAQGTVTLFSELLPRLFGRHLHEDLPKRILPISVRPPQDIQVLMDDEFTQLKELLASGSNNGLASEPKLRSLLAIDRALKCEATQISEDELQTVAEQIQQTDNWEDVFNGLSKVRLTADGTGVDVSIHLTKKDGMPVRIAAGGEEAEAVVAIRKVNDTDFYCYSTKALAKKVGLTVPKAGALIKHLKLQDNPECFKKIAIGRSQFKMYSGNALSEIKRALPEVDMDEVWKTHGAKPKKPR